MLITELNGIMRCGCWKKLLWAMLSLGFFAWVSCTKELVRDIFHLFAVILRILKVYVIGSHRVNV